VGGERASRSGGKNVDLGNGNRQQEAVEEWRQGRFINLHQLQRCQGRRRGEHSWEIGGRIEWSRVFQTVCETCPFQSTVAAQMGQVCRAVASGMSRARGKVSRKDGRRLV
jgi:hypothetical protein